MIRVGVVGLGKMGLSHLSMLNPHPEVTVAGICDPTRYVLDVLHRYTGVSVYADYEEMLDAAHLDAVLIATPSRLHAPMVEAALVRDIHVFCEKPLFLDPDVGTRLTAMARERRLVTQVGYHNRFVGTFAEVKELLEREAIGRPVHALAEAYGPVVLRPQRRSWRSRPGEGGGSLYDYAAHPLDLLTWYLGEPTSVHGALGHAFSKSADDTASATLGFDRANAVLSVNWSDESQRKMSTKMTIWGTHGRIYADRQEIQVYRRADAPPVAGYGSGWTIRYTTELTAAPWFYVRGEEYSAQLDAFVGRVQRREQEGVNTFASAGVTDRLIRRIADSASTPDTWQSINPPAVTPDQQHGASRHIIPTPLRSLVGRAAHRLGPPIKRLVKSRRAGRRSNV